MRDGSQKDGYSGEGWKSGFDKDIEKIFQITFSCNRTKLLKSFLRLWRKQAFLFLSMTYSDIFSLTLGKHVSLSPKEKETLKASP